MRSIELLVPIQLTGTSIRENKLTIILHQKEEENQVLDTFAFAKLKFSYSVDYITVLFKH